MSIPLTALSYNFSVEFVSGSFTDVTTKVIRANWGLGSVDLLTQPNPKTSMFELSNTDGVLTPINNTNLVPGKAIKLNALWTGTAGLFYNSSTVSHFARTDPSTLWESASGAGISLYLRVNSHWGTLQGIVDCPASGESFLQGNKQLYMNNGKVTWQITDGAGSFPQATDPTCPTLGQTYLYAGASFPGSYLALYRDGVLVNSVAALVGSISTAQGATHIKLGALAGPVTASRLSGVIDEFRIYRRGLTPEEISSQQGGLFSTDRLAAYWPLDEGAANMNARRAIDKINNIPMDFYSYGAMPANPNWITGISSPTTYPLFYGRITDVSISPTLGARTTIISAVDDWNRIRNLTFSSVLSASINVKSLWTSLMSMSSVRSFSVDNSVSDVVPFAWYRDRPADDAIYQLVRSGNYHLLVDGNGTWFLKNRNWYGGATSVATYTEQFNLDIQLSRESIINRVKTEGELRAADTTDNFFVNFITTTVSAGGTFTNAAVRCPAGKVTNFWARYSAYAGNSFSSKPEFAGFNQEIVVASAHQPYNGIVLVNGDGNTSILSLTSLYDTASVYVTWYASNGVVSLYNGSATDAYLWSLNTYGVLISKVGLVGVQVDNASNQSAFGVQQLTINDMLFNDRSTQYSLANFILTERQNGVATQRRTTINEFPDALSINPLNVFSVVDSFSGYTFQWRVRSTDHELSLVDGLRHAVTYDSELNGPYWIIESPTFGAIDSINRIA